MQKDIDYSKFKSLEEAYKAGYDQGVQEAKTETIQVQIAQQNQSLQHAYMMAQTSRSLRSMEQISNESIKNALPIVRQTQVIKQPSWFRRIVDKILH